MHFVNVIKAWFSRKKAEPQIDVVHVPSHKLRLHDWRKNKSLVSSALRTWENKDFQMMLQCAANEHLAMIELPWNTNIELRALQQARAEGYSLALANLEAMRSYKHDAALEPTYGAEEDKGE